MRGIFAQLKRRNVFRVAAAYVIVGWIVLQAGDLLLGIFEAPSWVAKTLAVIVAMGFPIACVFAWAFELTPEGVKRTVEVDEAASITAQTGRKLDLFTLVALIGLIGLTLWQQTRAPAPPQDVPDRVDTVEAVQAEPATDPASLAVLPFVNMSEDPAQEYFSDGISEEILNVLAGIDALRVASRTASFFYKDKMDVVTLPEIARDLKVAYVLEGSVRKASGQVRITAQLIKADDGFHLWSDTFDRSLEDIFAIQSEIANAIGAALREPLGLESIPVEVAPITDNLDAYDLFLQGREIFINRSLGADVNIAIDVLNRAAEIDPGFLEAHQYLAAVYGLAPWSAQHDRSMDEYIGLARQALDRALALDPDNAFSHAIRGYIVPPAEGPVAVYMLDNLNRALELDPDLVEALNWRGNVYVYAGLFELGIRDLDRCLELDPRFNNCRIFRSAALTVLNRLDEANDDWQLLLEAGLQPTAALDVPWELANGGRYRALLVARMLPGWEDAPVIDWLDLMENPRRDKETGLRKWREWAERHGRELDWAVLISYGVYDEVDLFWGSNDWIWLPMYSEFRQSEVFRQHAFQYGYPQLWRELGFPPMCRPVGDDDFSCE